jgi:hypothetical protein
MSFPEKKTVELEDSAWTAKREEEDAMDESTTVATLGKVSALRASGDTGSMRKRDRSKEERQHTRVFVESEKLGQEILWSKAQLFEAEFFANRARVCFGVIAGDYNNGDGGCCFRGFGFVDEGLDEFKGLCGDRGVCIESLAPRRGGGGVGVDDVGGGGDGDGVEGFFERIHGGCNR